MDEENKAPEETPAPEAKAEPTEEAKQAAVDAAKSIADDANKTMDEIKVRGFMGFLNFDTMYFPLVARYVFIAICLLTLVGVVLGVVLSFVSIFTGNILGGLIGIVGAIVVPLISLFFTRMWFELVLVGFKMNEALQDIRAKVGK